MSVIEAIHAKLPNTQLVMHGSSSVPQYLQDLINQSGGEMPQTYGDVYKRQALNIRRLRSRQILCP